MRTHVKGGVARTRGALLAGALALTSLVGCYRVASPPGPPRATELDQSRIMNTIAWGAFEDDDFDEICHSRGGIAEVTATTPPLLAVATVATLGFWAPMYVEAKCFKRGPNDAHR